jgi:hypothetical protein
MKRAGNLATAADRCTSMYPDSSGCRSVSRVSGCISGASSMKRIPRCAQLMAPGRGIPEPPPTRLDSDAV